MSNKLYIQIKTRLHMTYDQYSYHGHNVSMTNQTSADQYADHDEVEYTLSPMSADQYSDHDKVAYVTQMSTDKDSDHDKLQVRLIQYHLISIQIMKRLHM